MQRDFERLILGELDEAERDRVEARLLAEPQLLDQADAVEADLVDAYARNELSRERRRAFEERLQVSPRLQGRLAFAQTLRAAAPARRRGANAWWIPATAAATLATLAAGWLAVDRAQLRRERDALRAERDTRERRPTVDLGRSPSPTPPRAPVIAILALGLGAARDETRAASLVVPPRADSVRLDVDLEGAGTYRSVRAVVATEAGATVFTLDALRPMRHGTLWTVVVTVPADRLPGGRYVLTLEGVLRTGATETAAIREFEIVRR